MESAISGLAALDANQAGILDSWTGPTLVLGGPGSGKTTLLAHAAVAQIRAGGPPPLVLASGRTAASSMRNRITAELGEGAWQVQVTTAHSFARTVLLRYGEPADLRLLAAPEQEFRVRELLTGARPGDWPDAMKLAVGTRGFAAQVRACLARARQLGLDPEDLVTFGKAENRPEWSALGRFFGEYLDVLDAERVIDYAELVHRVRLMLAVTDIAEAVRKGIGAILVDDFTDLDPAQIGLLSSLRGGLIPILATADPASASSGFRGAHSRAVAEFVDQFTDIDAVPEVVTLEGTHRHGLEIAQALAVLREHLPRTPGAPTPAVADNGVPGSVQVLTCASLADEFQATIIALRRARLEQGIGYQQMAILVRSGRQIPALIRSLAAAGIPVEVNGEEIPLGQAPAVKVLLLGLSVAAAGVASPQDAVGLLTSPLCGLDNLDLRRLARLWRSVNPDADARSLAVQMSEAVNNPGWLDGLAADPALTRFQNLVSLLGRASRQLDAGEPVDAVAWTFWQGTQWPEQLRQAAAGNGPLGVRANADLDALCAFFDAAAQSAGRGRAGVEAFLAEVSAQQIPADHEREARLRGHGVQLLTAHRSRGREWELVVVPGVQEGSWPTGRWLSTVLDPAILTTSGLAGRAEYREMLAAERRLFHLACSRARRQLVITATTQTAGSGEPPSRFLAELGVDPQPPELTGAPSTLDELVVELRRVAGDANTAEALRGAAATELARLADVRDASQRRIVSCADPERWWGVLDLTSTEHPVPKLDPVWLSPSQVSAILDCPRRYFLTKEARGEGRPGTPQAVGSLIHKLIQQATQNNWGPTELADQLDLAWPHIPFVADWQSRVQRAEAELALVRFSNWRKQRTGTLLGQEVPFALELELDGISVQLNGKVDWLESDEAGLRVVDFKTSRSAPPAKSIERLDQLGIYQIAVAAGVLGEPAAWSVNPLAVYLWVPQPNTDLPRELPQQSLAVKPHLEDSDQNYPTWVHERVAKAAAVIVDGGFPATPGGVCRTCAFATSCPASPRGGQVV